MEIEDLATLVDASPRGALMDQTGQLRLALWRPTEATRPARGWLVFVGLNPSRADSHVDDPTIRRLVGFATRWSYRALVVVNVCAYRATRPADLVAWLKDGPTALRWSEMADNQTAIRAALAGAYRPDNGEAMVLCGWGHHGAEYLLDSRLAACRYLIWRYTQAQCLGLTRNGHPRHPLYLPYTAPVRPYADEGHAHGR